MEETVPPTVITPQQTLAPTVQRPHVAQALAEPQPTQPPTGPTILLDQERLLSQVPRGTHEGKAAPVLGGIPLLSKIGQGGMGAVYYGISPTSQAPVAVKVLPLQLEDQAHIVDRFLREARIATVVKSPHLVAVLDVGHDNGLYYFQMEYVRGKSAGGYLRGLVGEHPGCDEGIALEICIAATRGLAAAHEANIIHRDVKPDNILLPEDANGALVFEQAKLADLGLARSLSDDQAMTATQTALGTPGYMAPEQCRDAKRADMAADIFSMGATLYALLTGRPPFSGRTTVDTILATLTRQHLPVKQFRSDVSEMTCEVIERCLSKEPRIRYENASKLLEALLTCRDLRKGMSTLGLGLRTPVLPGAEQAPTVQQAHAVREARVIHVVKTPPAEAARLAQKNRATFVWVGCGLALVCAVYGVLGLPAFQRDAERQRAIAQQQAAAPVVPEQPVAPTVEEPAPAAAPTVAVHEPTPAEILLKRLHEQSQSAPAKVEPSAPARVETPAVKPPSDEEVRRAKAAQQRRQDAEQAQVKAEKLAKDADLAEATTQKAKGEFEAAQRELEKLQELERTLKDQFAQMDMKMRTMQQQRQGPGPGGNGPRGGERDRGGRGGQPPPPPPQQMDPRMQQMLAQMNDQLNKLRERLPQAQQQVRDRQQAFNKALYEQQKADGMAKMAADEATRLKEKLSD